jgi:hypothetical protein
MTALFLYDIERFELWMVLDSNLQPAAWRKTVLIQPGYSLLKNYNKRDPSQYEWKKGGDIRNDR